MYSCGHQDNPCNTGESRRSGCRGRQGETRGSGLHSFAAHNAAYPAGEASTEHSRSQVPSWELSVRPGSYSRLAGG